MTTQKVKPSVLKILSDFVLCSCILRRKTLTLQTCCAETQADKFCLLHFCRPHEINAAFEWRLLTVYEVLSLGLQGL